MCSLKPSPAASSNDPIAEHVFATLADQGVRTDRVRAIDFHIAPGVEADMGDGSSGR